MHKHLLFFTLLFFFSHQNFAQQKNVDEISITKKFENIHVEKMFSDTLASSFVIIVNKEVKPHKHRYHSEHIYVLSGEGKMILGEETIKIKSGDLVFIPKNTIHSLEVTSKEPVKVISFQAPKFHGEDRVMIE